MRSRLTARIGAALALPPLVPAPAEGKPAAVLVPLFAGPGASIHVWLARRPELLRQHGGQVAFPGGKPDPADTSLTATALREAQEEIGLDPAAVAVLGLLPAQLTSTLYLMTPVVGWIDGPFTPAPSPGEVSLVFSVDLSLFAAPAELLVIPGRGERPGHRAGGELVWGATGRVLQDLADRLFRRAVVAADPGGC
jgi:8-oxo-dGTP pyrophosphatase MutT (NUDIX family)